MLFELCLCLISGEMCLYPPQAQQPTVTASAVADKTAQLSWNAAVLPPECDSEVVSLAPVLYTCLLYTSDAADE